MLTGDGTRIEGAKGAGAARAGDGAITGPEAKAGATTGSGAGAGAKVEGTNLKEIGAGETGTAKEAVKEDEDAAGGIG
jgi:hypothetical protein